MTRVEGHSSLSPSDVALPAPLAFVARRLAKRVRVGALSVELPSGSRLAFAGSVPGPAADIKLACWRTVARAIWAGAMGLAEGYCAGEWTSSDLARLMEWGALNGPRRAQKAAAPTPLTQRGPARRVARRNIVAHYDLGNAFYGLWLDAGMSYSSGVFSTSDRTLEDAQQAKIARVVEMLSLHDAADTLEIGCGWGGLAVALAKSSKARVAALTLSPAQLSAACARAAEAGVADRVDLRLMDYRDVSETFDRIVAIEMIEAVGRRGFRDFFRVIRQRLRPGGLCVLQVITIAEERFAAYSRRPDFIQRYIFPGGFLPSKTLLREAIRTSGLTLVEAETFGPSYALTLREWRRRFVATWPEQERVGFEPSFRRLWEYYLAYCEGGFLASAIDVGLYAIRRAE